MQNTIDILDHIDPAALSYDEWLAVGMAIQHEGGTAQDWDDWSRRDTARHRDGECARKWTGFRGNGAPITGGTLVDLAKRQGWSPPSRDLGRAFGWDDVVISPDDDLRVVDLDWIEDADLQAPDDWDPVRDLSTYIRTLFEAQEHVGYVVDSWTADDGKRLPQKGCYARTAGEILDALGKCNGDIQAAVGDYDPDVGAWIRFNPLDGKGVADSNVTAFRFALVESDDIPIERQAAIYRDLELPVAVLVHSGKRSLHAIVRIDAGSIEEYRERVNFLFKVLEKNGIEKKARGNRNPSRLSRMPGVVRGDGRQYIVALNQGRPSWEDWRAYIEEANDSLPDFECLADVFDNLPDLAPALIDGVLREGHKLLISGPSKAGKSFLLLQLVTAIAEGRDWLGWQCRQGKVLYVNLELDRVSCLHRLKNLYAARGWNPDNIANIDLWNLRGKAVPMDALAPKLIRRALKKRYTAVVIDPIYKVITGDENAADKMAHFCNQFDRVCAELGSAVIYCHHHSKGAQGGKSARDRSSGSGVFARDPDAILDIIELAIPESLRKQVINRAVCDELARVLDAVQPDWRDAISQDDALVADKMVIETRRILGPGSEIDDKIDAVTARATKWSGWRLEGTLREFPQPETKSFWFRAPLHVLDQDHLLADAKADGEEPPWRKTRDERDKTAAIKSKQQRETVEMAYHQMAFQGLQITVQTMADHLGISDKTVRRRVQQHPQMTVQDGAVKWENQ